MSLKSTFSGNNEEAVLEEAIRGEQASLEEYDKLITAKNLPPTIDAMILKHRNAIQAAINTDKLNENIVS